MIFIKITTTTAFIIIMVVVLVVGVASKMLALSIYIVILFRSGSY